MQRNLIILLAIVVILLGGTLAFLLLRGEPRAGPIGINAADENALEPLHGEMDCIDRLLHRNDLEANQVEAELAGCRGGAPANQSAAQ